MKIRQWTTWLLVLAFVVLIPGVVLAQETENAASDLGPFATVISMIWDQLGLASPTGLGANINPDGATAEGTGNDMGPSTSPDGLTAEGTSNDMGPSTSPDG